MDKRDVSGRVGLVPQRGTRARLLPQLDLSLPAESLAGPGSLPAREFIPQA